MKIIFLYNSHFSKRGEKVKKRKGENKGDYSRQERKGIG